MSRKSKEPTPVRPAPTNPKGSFAIFAGGAVLALLFLIGLWAYSRQAEPPAPPAAAQATPPSAADVPEINRRPHPNATTPPLRFPGYTMPRPPEVVQAAYKFAAEHPEV